MKRSAKKGGGQPRANGCSLPANGCGRKNGYVRGFAGPESHGQVRRWSEHLSARRRARQDASWDGGGLVGARSQSRGLGPDRAVPCWNLSLSVTRRSEERMALSGRLPQWLFSALFSWCVAAAWRLLPLTCVRGKSFPSRFLFFVFPNWL